MLLNSIRQKTGNIVGCDAARCGQVFDNRFQHVHAGKNFGLQPDYLGNGYEMRSDAWIFRGGHKI